MNCRKKNYEVGDLVTVRHCWGGYQLPIGLLEGASVKVISKEIGHTWVEFNSKKFVVPVACIESGWQYRFDGKWRDESDPAVIARLATQPKRHVSSKRAIHEPMI